MTNAPHTDIRADSWVSLLPAPLRPYALLMRLDRPIGTWLLLLPGWWGIAIMNGGLHLYLLFAFGAIIMRGAGCVVNDLWDRDFDKSVERTKSRPLASEAVTTKQAILFITLLLALGFLILLQLPPLAIAIGVVSLIPVALYPLAKRITWYPQAVLGLTFNFGALMGAAAASNTLPPAAMLLYIAGFFWTIGYDTIYAFQDREDDEAIGVKSTALKFGNKSRSYIAGLYTVAALLIFIAGYMLHPNALFFVFWGCACLHLIWQVARWDMTDNKDCLQKFRSNRDFGLLVFAGLLFGL